MSRNSTQRARVGRPRRERMADRADRHALYEQSVQDVEFEVDFIDKTFHSLNQRRPHRLREDFCGTAKLCCEWARRRRTNQAIGVDNDGEVLAWGREHNLAGLTAAQAKRVSLLHEDVRRVDTELMDVVLALNFSYQLLKDRDSLKGYFRSVREALVDDGVFILDVFGGYEAYKETRERREVDGFTYTWEQASYDPITGDMRCHIHFKFPDGSRLAQAFTYDWRLWTLPEIRELLADAGFGQITVYWEGTDPETGEGNGEYSPATVGEADPAWICYVIARK